MTVAGNAVAVIDPGSNRVVGQVPKSAPVPASIAFGSGSLWVANLDDQTVARIDPRHTQVARTFPVDDTPTGPGDARAAPSGSSARTRRSPSVIVRRIDPRFDTVAGEAPDRQRRAGRPGLGRRRTGARSGSPRPRACSLASTRAPARVAGDRSECGPDRDRVGADAVWVTDSWRQHGDAVDPHEAARRRSRSATARAAIAVGAGGVWVADTLDDAVVRIDPGHAVGDDHDAGRRAPPASRSATARSGSRTAATAPSRGSMRPRQASSRRSTSAAARRACRRGRARLGDRRQTRGRELPGRQAAGGTRASELRDDVDSMDPALAYSPLVVGIPRTPPARSSSTTRTSRRRRLAARARGRPVAADALGRRQDLHLHDPQGLPLLAALERAGHRPDLQVPIERSLSPRMKGPRCSGYLSDVVGAKAYMAGKAPHISGIVAQREQADGPTRRRLRPDLPVSPRSAVLLRGADRHAARPEGGPASSPRRGRTTSRPTRPGRASS